MRQEFRLGPLERQEFAHRSRFSRVRRVFAGEGVRGTHPPPYKFSIPHVTFAQPFPEEHSSHPHCKVLMYNNLNGDWGATTDLAPTVH